MIVPSLINQSTMIIQNKNDCINSIFTNRYILEKYDKNNLAS